MLLKEFCELKLKEYPDGIWIGIHFKSGYYGYEQYLDEYYMTEFEGVLDKEVENWYLDECDYDILEVFLND